ncbi:hypothetical protein N7452_001617 [Penicillium brevicompactum]|uniref:Uncharacterized protein n=1 Tax=Penicillium brevicompactum TaxID=5074 RepID=A0A9W9UPE4_PENBR|nr:hypothetical protein N7452_001617 [Penicillium brevicompactum]
MPHNLSILVYQGVPVDFSKYRHTALYADWGDEHEWLHVVGGHPFFAFQKNEQNPISEEPIAKIPVCSIPESISRSGIHVACVSTPVRNGDEFRDWNCQNWVGEALAELVGIGCVTGVEREVAIGKMVEVILEAELEDDGMY